MTAWILAGKLDSLALIIMNRDTREVVERWQFDVQVEEPPEAAAAAAGSSSGKENQGCVVARSPALSLCAGSQPCSRGAIDASNLPIISRSCHRRPTPAAGQPSAKPKGEKTPEQVQKDIQDIMRQITSSVTFLPALEEQCELPCFVREHAPVWRVSQDLPHQSKLTLERGKPLCLCQNQTSLLSSPMQRRTPKSLKSGSIQTHT